MSGEPAAALTVELFDVGEESGRLLATLVTNADGRCDRPLLEGDALAAGTYELLFHVGAYFRTRLAAPSEPAFLDVVPVRFGVSDPDRHYHVPLLVSPYGYSTYRGS